MYFKIMRSFWDFCFSNPDKINTNHIAIFCFIVEHCNRLGWKEKFSLPTMMACEAVGIKSVNTYSKAFNELVDMGLIKLIQKSKNQWSANVIAISIIDEPIDKALDTALIKHVGQHLQSTCDSTDTIIRPNTNYQIPNTNKTKKEVSNTYSPDFEEVWVLYRRKGGKKAAYQQWKKLPQQDRDKAKNHIPSYVSTRELTYQKDLERYLKDGHYESDVMGNTPMTPQTQQASLYE